MKDNVHISLLISNIVLWKSKEKDACRKQLILLCYKIVLFKVPARPTQHYHQQIGLYAATNTYWLRQKL